MRGGLWKRDWPRIGEHGDGGREGEFEAAF